MVALCHRLGERGHVLQGAVRVPGAVLGAQQLVSVGEAQGAIILGGSVSSPPTRAPVMTCTQPEGAVGMSGCPYGVAQGSLQIHIYIFLFFCCNKPFL